MRSALVSGYYALLHAARVVSKLGREWAEDTLREQEPFLIRKWCGHDAVSEFNQVSALQEEADRP